MRSSPGAGARGPPQGRAVDRVLAVDRVEAVACSCPFSSLGCSCGPSSQESFPPITTWAPPRASRPQQHSRHPQQPATPAVSAWCCPCCGPWHTWDTGGRRVRGHRHRRAKSEGATTPGAPTPPRLGCCGGGSCATESGRPPGPGHGSVTHCVTSGESRPSLGLTFSLWKGHKPFCVSACALRHQNMNAFERQSTPAWRYTPGACPGHLPSLPRDHRSIPSPSLSRGRTQEQLLPSARKL